MFQSFGKIYIGFCLLLTLSFCYCKNFQTAQLVNNCRKSPIFSSANTSELINLDFNISYLQNSSLIPNTGLPPLNIQNTFEQFDISCQYGTNNIFDIQNSSQFLVRCNSSNSKQRSWKISYKDLDSFLLEGTQVGIPNFLSYNYSILNGTNIETKFIEITYNFINYQIVKTSTSFIYETRSNRSIETNIILWDSQNRPLIGLTNYYLNPPSTPYCTNVSTIYSYADISYNVSFSDMEQVKTGTQQSVTRIGGTPSSNTITCPLKTEYERNIFNDANFLVVEDMQIQPDHSFITTYVIRKEENVCLTEN